ncbi:MAG: beta-lactamase family protein [Lachnospiraceae bacterium]|nr:beta-lactamase family protein [Lachnospiraceae bacterium]
MKRSLSNVIDSYIEKKEISGASVLVFKDGKRLASVHRGFADVARAVPYSPDTIIRLYSMSKPITSAAVMMLIEHGLLDRQDPVSDYIPSFKKQFYYDASGEKKPVSREMTISDLLDMSGGLSYPDDATPAGREAAELFKTVDERLGTKDEMSTMEIAEAIGGLTLAFDPGSDYLYSTSADVLGAVVEKVSGIKFSEFLAKELFNPLNMNDTGFYVPEDKQPRLARSYVAASHMKNGPAPNEKPISDDGTDEYLGSFLGIKNRMETPPAFESGGAGLASTLSDYMKFAQMLLRGGSSLNGERILSPETVRHMTGRQRPAFITDRFHEIFELYGFTYSNLLRVCYAPEEGDTIMFKGEYGWDGWLGPYFANIPSKNATILFGMQMTDFGTFSLTHKIINIIAAEL